MINQRRQSRVRKIFRAQVFAEFACILCLKLLYQKCVTFVVGYSFIKTWLLKEYSGQYSVLIQIHIVTGNEKLCKIYLKKNYFFKMF